MTPSPSSLLDGLRSVTRTALLTRLAVVCTAIVCDLLIADYDTSSHALKCLTSSSSNSWDCLVRRLLGGFGAWDGVYFRRIAEHGYENEQNFAFFPLLPVVLQLGRHLPGLSVDGGQLLVGVLFSQLCFVLAARELYKLTALLCTDDHDDDDDGGGGGQLARTAALLFCLTPAGVFMSAVYSESLFACLSLLSLRLLAERRRWLAAAALALAGCARSNAFLLVVFFVAATLRQHGWRPAPGFLLAWLACAAQCALAVLPIVAYQLYAAALFCPGRSWCHAWPVPAVYSFVQAHYWGNGVFAYWQAKQLPNFLLASPMIVFSAAAIARYAVHWLRAPARLLSYWRLTCATNNDDHHYQLLLHPQLLPYYALWLLMLVIAVVAMHVQVITRFFCALPPLYWSAAAVRSPAARRLVVGYFVVYTALGAVFFPNFYPWT